jgi:Mg/Co/Ni transporter MgtE
LDWLAYGLSIERPDDVAKTVIDHLDRNIPTVLVTDSIGEIRSRPKNSGKPVLLPVVNDQNVLLGLIDKPFEDVDPTTPVGEVMDPGPTTMRPYTPIESAVERLAGQNLGAAPVTSSDGKLMGLFRRP